MQLCKNHVNLKHCIGQKFNVIVIKTAHRRSNLLKTLRVGSGNFPTGKFPGNSREIAIFFPGISRNSSQFSRYFPGYVLTDFVMFFYLVLDSFWSFQKKIKNSHFNSGRGRPESIMRDMMLSGPPRLLDLANFFARSIKLLSCCCWGTLVPFEHGWSYRKNSNAGKFVFSYRFIHKNIRLVWGPVFCPVSGFCTSDGHIEKNFM